jgi:hypothetical protein
VGSDKEALGSAISGLDAVAQEYMRASQNHSHASALSLNLAERAFSSAHGDARKDQQRAEADFNKALKDLKSASAKGNLSEVETAEKVAKQKAAKVDKLDRQVAENAKRSLRTQRSGESKKVMHAYQKANTAGNKLLKDRNHLEEAMRRSGKSEEDYEGLSQHLEQHAERQMEYAERNRDRTADAVEHIFENAQDHLDDRTQQQHDRSAEMREQALEAAMSSLQRQQVAQTSKQQSAQASPVTAALNLFARTQATHSPSNLTQQQKRKQEEQDAQHAVDSDKTSLSNAMKHMDTVASNLQKSLKNKTHAEALAANLAKGVFDEAAANKKDEKKKASSDFHRYLLELKSASPMGNWSNALKKVEDQARYLDKLDDEQMQDARMRLHSKHASQKTQVRGAYHEAHNAAMNLLRDKNRLENAMRHAGAKESEYEREEEKNEELGESSQDKVEDLHDNADDAAQQMYETSEGHLHALQHSSRKEQHYASRDRQQQVHDAVQGLKNAAKAKTSTKKAQAQGGDIVDNEDDLEASQVLVAPNDVRSSYLLAFGSLGLLLFFNFRRTRPTLVAPPLLG